MKNHSGPYEQNEPDFHGGFYANSDVLLICKAIRCQA
jgi:hypothetical protein